MILAGVGFGGTDHVGLTVPDLDEAIAFFEQVFGAQTILRHPGYSPSAEVNVGNFAREPEVTVEGIAMVRVAGMNFELLQYENDSLSGQWPTTDATGGHHVAFYVADLDRAVVQLRAASVEVLGDPLAMAGPEAGPGARFVYFRAPWGMFFELVSYPSGKAYESSALAKLAAPR